MSAACKLLLVACLLILVSNDNVVKSDLDFFQFFDVSPWDYYNYGPPPRRIVWDAWGDYYYVPAYSWRPYRDRYIDPPDHPDPITRRNQQPTGRPKVKKVRRRKIKKKPQPKPQPIIEEQEHEHEGPPPKTTTPQPPRPRKRLRVKKVRRRLRKRKRQNQTPI